MKPDGHLPDTPVAGGVNIVGYFRAELGVGEAARLLTKAVEAAGIPYVTIPWDRTRSRQQHAFSPSGGDEPIYDTTILCVNADQVPVFAEHAGSSFFEGRYTIGQWMWEVEPFPESMFDGFDYVDEVWVASEHAAGAIAAVSPRPVLVMPPPLLPPPHAERTRPELGLPDGFVFLFLFDFLSIAERKNAAGLIEAFTNAFSNAGGPTLVIKTINGDKRPDDLERLRRLANRPDIIVSDGYLAAEEKNALIASCDALVSLHRSEGIGLVLAEAMALGKPVIATGYSGNLTFMDEANSFLVPYALTRIPEGCDPYPAGGTWAEPDVDAAAKIMRHVVEHPEEARDKGGRARQDILSRHSPAERAPVVARRLEQIRRWRDVSRGAPSPAVLKPGTARPRAPHRPAGDDLSQVPTALARAEELIVRGPSTTQRTRFGGAGRAWRRFLFRVLRPYSWHQRQVMTALLETAKELHRREMLSSGETILWLTDRIGRLQHEVGRLAAQSPAAYAEIRSQLDDIRATLDSLEEPRAAPRE